MRIEVECPCGKVFIKPESKVGTFFRCHHCGQEVEISKERVQSDESVTVLPPTASSVVKRSRRKRESGPIDIASPAKATSGRTIGAWLLIVVGITFIVAGAGQIYIFSIIEQTRAEHAKAQVQFFGAAPTNRRSGDASIAYMTAGVGIVIGVLLSYVGVRIRKP